jgi:hypothetical protein
MLMRALDMEVSSCVNEVTILGQLPPFRANAAASLVS